MPGAYWLIMASPLKVKVTGSALRGGGQNQKRRYCQSCNQVFHEISPIKFSKSVRIKFAKKTLPLPSSTADHKGVDAAAGGLRTRLVANSSSSFPKSDQHRRRTTRPPGRCRGLITGKRQRPDAFHDLYVFAALRSTLYPTSLPRWSSRFFVAPQWPDEGPFEKRTQL